MAKKVHIPHPLHSREKFEIPLCMVLHAEKLSNNLEEVTCKTCLSRLKRLKKVAKKALEEKAQSST